jgi:chromosome segregation ATPase
MSKLTDIFGRRESEDAETPPVASAAETPDTPETANAPAEPRKTPRAEAADGELTGAKIGEENEALRNLLVDAGMKIRQFDEYKIFFGKLIEPATQALRSLEHEKTSNIDLRRKLEQTTQRCDELRARAHELETRHAILVSENEKLRQELDLARLEARDAERSRAEFAAENISKRNAVANLERLLALEVSRVNTLSDDNQRLRDETVAAEAKASRLAAEVSAANDKINFLEGESLSLQKSLDQVSEQATHASRRFTDSETALTTAKKRILVLEASNNELAQERDRLRTTLEANSQRHGSEQERVQMQIDAVRARAAAAEKLLTEARQLLAQRGEEMRTLDQKAGEADYMREKAAKRIADLEAQVEKLQAELSEIKSGRDKIIEKSSVVVNALKLRETQLQRTEEAVKGANERVTRLEAELRDNAEAFQRRIQELVSSLERERLDHEVTEGALESTRRERDQLQSDMLQLQMQLNRLSVNDDEEMKFPTRGANAA